MSDPLKIYTGDALDVTFDPRRCIHAAECVAGLPAVFDTAKRPWVRPDQAPAQAVADVVRRCPTGALHIRRKDGGPPETPPPANHITPVPDGPLYLHGHLELVDEAGQTLLTETRLALCRCGASQNKPFCDGAHAQIGFRAGPSLARPNLAPASTTGGPLRIRATPAGPLRLSGPFRLHAPGEAPPLAGEQAELCRCGHAATKPFCDWSHVAAGFEAG